MQTRIRYESGRNRTRTRLAPGLRGTVLLRVLRHLQKNHSDPLVRSLAGTSLLDGSALVGLHDHLEEMGHPEAKWLNYREAALTGKLEQDEAVRRATRETASELTNTILPLIPNHLAYGLSVYMSDPMRFHERYGVHHLQVLRQIKDKLPDLSLEHITDSLSRLGQTQKPLRYLTDTLTDSKRKRDEAANDNLRRVEMASELPVLRPLYVEKADYSRIRSGLRKLQRRLRSRTRYERSTLRAAVALLRSRQQAQVRAMAEDIHRSLGLNPSKVLDALRIAARSGPEPDTVQALYHDSDPDSVRYAAAWYGLYAKKNSLGLFHVQDDGPDSLYRVRYDGQPDELTGHLNRAGLRSHTLIRTRNGFDAIVADPQSKLRDRIESLAQSLNVDVEESVGNFESIGHSDPTQARAAFRDVINQFENSTNGQRD